jgi:hypothetical protein
MHACVQLLLVQHPASHTVDSVLFTAVIYLTDVVGLDITQVGIFFLVALLGTIPGA